MPFFKVTLNQGRTFTLEIEAQNLAVLQGFLSQVTTAKVMSIQQLVYKAPDDDRPIDDKLYKRRERYLCRSSNGHAVQLDIPHVPLSRSIGEVITLIKSTVEINGSPVDMVICGLSTGPELQGS